MHALDDAVNSVMMHTIVYRYTYEATTQSGRSATPERWENPCIDDAVDNDAMRMEEKRRCGSIVIQNGRSAQGIHAY